MKPNSGVLPESKPMSKIPSEAAPKKAYRSAAEMARDLLPDEPEFVAGLEARLYERQFVKSLAIARARAGLTQKELAAKLGCTQSKISKLESGVDADLRFGDIAAYLEAVEHEAKIFVIPGNGTLADEVKMHAFRIKHILDELVRLAANDGAIAKGVGAFIEEAAFNLVKLTMMAKENLPQHPANPGKSIRVETPEAEGSGSPQRTLALSGSRK
jgi:transcriptional regulator with XRE-family HTH domain